MEEGVESLREEVGEDLQLPSAMEVIEGTVCEEGQLLEVNVTEIGLGNGSSNDLINEIEEGVDEDSENDFILGRATTQNDSE